MLQDLKKRLISSILVLPLVFFLILGSSITIVKILTIGFLGLLSYISVWEYVELAKEKGTSPSSSFLIPATICLTLSFFLSTFLENGFIYPVLTLFLETILLFISHFKKNEGAILNLAVSLFGLIYISVPLGMILAILFLPNIDGKSWVFYLLLISKISDVGAYFGGNIFGRRKLAPNISPGKTVEGAICGLMSAVLASYAFSQFSFSTGQFFLGKYEWVYLGLLLAILAQLGDLAESLLKRDAKKKDSNYFPGLGGALDTVDSILFNAPIVYIYIGFLR
jgi:phosphatidate cytidylyltransferase